ALVDKGYMDNATFETAINAYKEKYSLTDSDIVDGTASKIDELISSLCDFSSTDNEELYTEFVSLLFNNLIRFVGDDFTPLEPLSVIKESDNTYQTTQGITGPFTADTSIVADEDVMIAFASRYADEELTSFDEYVSAAACDFINLHNGLFTVNVSNSNEIELRLTPPYTNKGIEKTDKKLFILPICYPFGTVSFTITL
ncbi:MAG: hypothetical protein IJ272_03685, partial [Clostridia bacterium]|nr:hypothetical protein [Clostridia bacterium]